MPETKRPYPDWEWIHKRSGCPVPTNCVDPSGCTARGLCSRNDEVTG